MSFPKAESKVPEVVLHALRTLLHLQSANLSTSFKDKTEGDLPQKIGLGTAHSACVVSVLIVERVAALVQSIDLHTLVSLSSFAIFDTAVWQNRAQAVCNIGACE
jgi:hypothetical protein